MSAARSPPALRARRCGSVIGWDEKAVTYDVTAGSPSSPCRSPIEVRTPRLVLYGTKRGVLLFLRSPPGLSSWRAMWGHRDRRGRRIKSRRLRALRTLMRLPRSVARDAALQEQVVEGHDEEEAADNSPPHQVERCLNQSDHDSGCRAEHTAEDARAPPPAADPVGVAEGSGERDRGVERHVRSPVRGWWRSRVVSDTSVCAPWALRLLPAVLRSLRRVTVTLVPGLGPTIAQTLVRL